MVYPTDEETFAARVSPEWIKEAHLNDIGALLKRIQDFIGYGGRIHDEKGLVTPVGAWIGFGGVTAPDGWLLCDGKEYTRAHADYSDLFAVIGTGYGARLGTLFNVPDFRGYFQRGYVGVDSVNFATTDVDTVNNWMTVTGQKFNRAAFPVRFSTTDTLPAPLVINTTYWTVYAGLDRIFVSTSRVNSLVPAVVDITTVGVGTHTVIPWLEEDKASRLKLTAGGEDAEDLGSFQVDAFQAHKQQLDISAYAKAPNGNLGYGWSGNVFATTETIPDNPLAADGAFGAPRIAIETRPRNVYANYIIKR